MGHILDGIEGIGIGRRTNVDTLDIAAFKGRSANEFMLEGIDTAGICMYADIRHMAVVGDVVF